MNCKFDEKILHLYLDNELGPNAEARVIEHLKYCADCQAKLQSLQVLRNELSGACLAIKAPPQLQERIMERLEPAANSKTVELSFLENIRLAFMKLRLSQALASGLIFAVILFLVFVPGGKSLNSIAGNLAKEHLEWQNNHKEYSIRSNESSEINAYLNKHLGFETDVPEFLGGDYQLKGAYLIKLMGKPAAFVCYATDDKTCSFFIVDKSVLESSRTKIFVASGVEFEFGSTHDLNLIGWQKGDLAYILCSCCPHEKLVNMAVSSI